MTEKEFYDYIGGSYEEAVGRLMSDSLIRKFLLKFRDDKSFSQLNEALNASDTDAAFAAAHTLKGVTLNLAFSVLSDETVKLTDYLRPENRSKFDKETAKTLFYSVEAEYKKIIKAIDML